MLIENGLLEAALDRHRADVAPHPRSGRGIVPLIRTLARPLLHRLAVIRHGAALRHFHAADPHGLAAAFARSRPELAGLLRTRFLTTRWNASDRFVRIANHCDIAQGLGRPFDVQPDDVIEVARLPELGEGMRLVLDSPRWLLLEGLLSLNLFDRRERLYSIAFIFAGDGRPTVYIGGIQGRCGAGMRDRYRDLTRLAHGVRPADLLVELLRMLCAEIGVERLRAVSARVRHPNGALIRDDGDPVRFDYDALWRERGGIPAGDGFYDLPIDPPRRSLGDVPTRKRAERRRRYELLDALRWRLTEALAGSRTFADMADPRDV